MTRYSISSGQGGHTQNPENQKNHITVSDTTLRQHVETKSAYIGSFVIKLAALEHKSQLLKDCLANRREAPEEWRTERKLPVLPSSIHYSFSTTLDIEGLQCKFDKEWMQKLEKDMSANLIPRLIAKIDSLVKEAEQEITTEIDNGDLRTRALTFLEEDVRKKKEVRGTTYTDGQQTAASVAKRRKSYPPNRQPRGPFKPRDSHQRQPLKQNQRHNNNRNNNYRRAGWRSSKDDS
jgi:hypothetical protein